MSDAVVAFIDDRIASCIQYPDAWGGRMASALQVWQLLDVRSVAVCGVKVGPGIMEKLIPGDDLHEEPWRRAMDDTVRRARRWMDFDAMAQRIKAKS